MYGDQKIGLQLEKNVGDHNRVTILWIITFDTDCWARDRETLVSANVVSTVLMVTTIWDYSWKRMSVTIIE